MDVLVQDGQLKVALEEAERNKNRTLTWILDEWKENVLSPSYEQMQQLLNNSTAAVYWHLGSETLTTFILKYGASEPSLINADLATSWVEEPSSLHHRLEFEAWKRNWDHHYATYRSKGKNQVENKRAHPWHVSMIEALEKLKEILNIPAIESELSGITQLILIPHRDFHRFPLHTLFADRFAITCLPSAQIGLTLQKIILKLKSYKITLY